MSIPCSGASVTAANYPAAARILKSQTSCLSSGSHSLIPFPESQNDLPTHGLALCKNHHWAMDRNLIAPCPETRPGKAAGDAGAHWHVSKILNPRRSNGERELMELSGKSLLLPQDEAFHPDAEGLNWRLMRRSI
jgi:putative restriction endonuclease